MTQKLLKFYLLLAASVSLGLSAVACSKAPSGTDTASTSTPSPSAPAQNTAANQTASPSATAPSPAATVAAAPGSAEDFYQRGIESVQKGDAAGAEEACRK